MRRLRLNISTELLEHMHPADLADIVEDLSPEDREAIMSSIDSETAADALTEVDPDIQASILESLTPKPRRISWRRCRPIRLPTLGELDEKASETFSRDGNEPQEEVRELLEFHEDSAGGMMVWYLASRSSSVADAIQAMRGSRSARQLNTIFLVDDMGMLQGAVPVARLFCMKNRASSDSRSRPAFRSCNGIVAQTELFDKYNLLTLPVTDDEGNWPASSPWTM
jgi:Mg/Co/Ni transporter MgtE